MKEIEGSRRIPVTESADVVVCGAGPAGWIAAIAAARQGLSVILADRYGFPGGT
ncbi:MAG: FAD-dependent oxidoreductase, partial [Clostridia bacterium]|nr:FAD-dependent oxidoreductase [Clostridia bacterium]